MWSVGSVVPLRNDARIGKCEDLNLRLFPRQASPATQARVDISEFMAKTESTLATAAGAYSQIKVHMDGFTLLGVRSV